MLYILTEALINVISAHISRPDRSKMAVILQTERERELKKKKNETLRP